jgi:hypothetical protein
MKRTSFQSILYVSAFAIVGGAIGLISGFIIEPNFGNLVFWPLIIGSLDGIYLSWMYKSKDISINLVTRISIGIVIGMFLGSFLGGMLGTILSIPFPSTFFPTIFLIGTFLGMFIGGAVIPVILVSLGYKTPK